MTSSHSLWGDILTRAEMQSCNCNECSEKEENDVISASRIGILPDQRGLP